jgi:hypothetical protein
MAEAKFVVNGKEYPIATDLTLGEMCDAERYFGVEFGNNATSGVRMSAAVLYFSIRRVDDSVTVDDVRALPPDVFNAFGEAPESDPQNEDVTEKNDGSGGSSPDGGDAQDNSQSPTGPPGSETSASSVRVISAA